MRLVFIVCIAALLAGACLAQQLAPCDGLSQGVRAEKPVYEIGEPTNLQFAVLNTSGSPIVFNFPTGKQFDIWISRGDGEIFRASKGRAYPQAATSLMIRPGEMKTFCAQWNQVDQNTGKQVGPGVYTIYAQLTSNDKNPPPVTTGKVQIGMASAALVPITVCEAINNAQQLLGRRVMINATYRGSAPDASSQNTAAGPPVTRSDWAICDRTGCMYVTGAITLDPARDAGTPIAVAGRIARTEQGQVYVILLSATTSRGSVCPR